MLRSARAPETPAEEPVAPPTPFLTDEEHPLDPAGDRFAHGDYVDSIAEAIPRLPSPFTLGLFGPWGSGKSSILRAVARKFDDSDDVAFVVFDAWKYEGDPLRRQFMIEVTRQLDGKLKKRFDVRRHLERYDADVTAGRPRLELDWRNLLRAVVLAAVAVGAVYALYRLLPRAGLDESNTLKATLAAVAGGLTFILTAVGGAIGVHREQISRRRLQDADQFADSFETLVEKGLDVRRLAIGIDNLDRCAPERVTELLATIKTYLEPARAGNELTFLIATDDAALRRHLIAQEMTVSAAEAASTRNGDTDRAEKRVPDDVADAVDEYLRKYFNGVVQLGGIIDEDLEAFVREQLAGLVAEHDVDPETCRGLEQLLGGFLGGNPRRIKQFVNGLQFRVDLLSRRAGNGGLAQGPDPLVVAELMLLEDRWPDRFRALRHDTHITVEWRRELDDEPSGEISRSEADWRRFLAVSRRLLTTRLSPYLALRQGQAEGRLAGYRDFIEALENRKPERVQEVFAASPDPELLRELVWPRYWRHFCRDRHGSAARVLATSVAVPGLVPKPARVEMLRLSLQRPSLRTWLGDIPPGDVLPLAEDLCDADRQELVRVYLEVFSGEDEPGRSRRRLVCEAFAKQPGVLSYEHLLSLWRMLKRPHVHEDGDSWVSLAEALPAVVPLEAIEAQLASLEQAGEAAPHHSGHRILSAIASSSVDSSAWEERFWRTDGGPPDPDC